MRAVCLDFERRTPAEIDLPDPVPAPGELLLRLLEIGVCATDRELARFRFGEPPAGESHLVLGHEALAEVVTPGGGFESGDLVVPTVRRSCLPPCHCCVAGRRDLCASGRYSERGIFRAHGYFAGLVVDRPSDLIPVPPALSSVAVLAEPLSVVEKAVETALRAHPHEPRTAAIAGAGPVGLLTALALQARGISPSVASLEPDDHPRIRLLRQAGIPYHRSQNPPPADLVFEASGSNQAASAVFHWLAPCGVLVFIGAPEHEIALPPLRLLADNLTVCGTVNAAPHHFRLAFMDLARISRPLLEALIERRPFAAWPSSFSAASIAPKLIHSL